MKMYTLDNGHSIEVADATGPLDGQVYDEIVREARALAACCNHAVAVREGYSDPPIFIIDSVTGEIN